jgi:hypothetical protein
MGLAAMGILSIFWCLGSFDGHTGDAPSASFRGYEGSEDGADVVAVLWLTNSSERTFEYFSANAMSSNGTEMVCCEFSDQTKTGWTNWIAAITRPNYTSFTLPPHSGTLVAAQVPKDGRVRRVAVICIDPHKRLTGILARLRKLWWRVRPPRIRSMRVWCDTELSYQPQTYHESAK